MAGVPLLIRSLCLVLLSGVAAAAELPVVSPPPGSHYDVMRAVGVAMKDRMQTYAKNFAGLDKVLRPFVKTTEGAAVVAAYIKTNKALFPNTFDEIRGLADGSELGLETLILMELRNELLHHARFAPPGSGIDPSAAAAFSYEAGQECSDVLTSSKKYGQWHAHNEDAPPILKEVGFMVNATFLDSAGKVESGYVGFHYPLSTIGHSFSFNIHGMHISMNSVTPASPPTAGDVAIFFLCRHISDATSFQDAVDRASLLGINNNVSWGGSLNIGSLHEGILANVEVSAGPYQGHGARVDVLKAEGDHETIFHFNMFLRSKGVKQEPQESSIHRLARSESLREEMSEHGEDFVKAVVSDIEDDEYPTYRTVGNVVTAASGVFDNINGTLAVWYDRPATAGQPDFVFDMRTRHAFTPAPATPLQSSVIV